MFTNPIFLTICAFLPIVFFLFAFYVMNMPPMQAGWTAIVIACCISFFVWQTPLPQVAASVVQGVFHGGHYSIMLFCSVWMFGNLYNSKALLTLHKTFAALHSDRRVQAIVVCTLFGPGVETTLCFSPSIGIVTLLLGGLRFPAACACMVAVLGMIVANGFSSMGHSILTGVNFGLSDPAIISKLASEGVSREMLYRAVSAKVGLVHGFVGIFMPLLMVMMMTRFFGRNKSWTEGLSITPFAIFCGLAFVIPYTLTAIYVGPEFPSLVGSLVGLAVVFFAIHHGFLFPHDRWDFPPREEWPGNWVGDGYTPPQTKLPVSTAWLTYFILIAALVVTRIPLVGNWLQSFPINISNLFGSNVSLFSPFLYLPAVVLFVLGWIFAWKFKIPTVNIRDSFGGWSTALMMIGLFNVVLITLAHVYMNSSINGAHLAGMGYYLVSWLTAVPGGQYWCPFLSPFIAGLGTFAAANSTNSNMIYSTLQCYGAMAFDFSMSTFLALQVTGAGVGNILSDHYFALPGAVIGFLGWEGPSIRRIIFFMVIYLIFLGLLGILLTQFPVIFTFILGSHVASI